MRNSSPARPHLFRVATKIKIRGEFFAYSSSAIENWEIQDINLIQPATTGDIASSTAELNHPNTKNRLIGGVVGGRGVDSVAVTSASSRVNLEAAAAVSTEVVHVGGVLPVSVDGGVVVESTLKQKRMLPQTTEVMILFFMIRCWVL